jgi:hypothetical protein
MGVGSSQKLRCVALNLLSKRASKWLTRSIKRSSRKPKERAPALDVVKSVVQTLEEYVNEEFYFVGCLGCFRDYGFGANFFC